MTTSETELFGPYVVYERLGVGGMATVHRARSKGIEGFERIVALKRLLPHLAEDATFVKSFVREAKFASMLQHANIVQLYELGRVGPTYYISMELIDGRDVRRILNQARKLSGPPPINVTLSLLIQLCDALEYAHARCDENGQPLGLVHRDVSPSNLLVTKSGHLKVIDFGIAKAQAAQLHTQDGKVKGKLAYMAPEAITGNHVDARSDIFSVGVIAHELLTARTLFASKSEFQTLINVQRSEVQPPSSFNPAVQPELDAIVAQALSREQELRYQSAGQMRDDLHAVRIKYGLSATNREVEAWCNWAFSQDSATKPSPVRDDDEAVAIAWGGANDGSAPPMVHEVPDVASRSRSMRMASVSATIAAESFGSGIVGPKGGSSLGKVVAAVASVALIAVGGYVLLTRGGKQAAASNVAQATMAAPAGEQMASLKFIVEPDDATVKIAGMEPHVGGSWKVELDPGVVQIKVSREGHQSWETSVELSSGENQTIRVALAEAVGDPNLATLSVGSQPAGMSVLLDGKDTGEKTPWQTQLPAGSHTVQLRDASGAIAWKHTWQAEARTLYEFTPSMDEAKRQERVARENLALTGRAPAARPAVALPSAASGSGSASASGLADGSGSASAVEPPSAPPPTTDAAIAAVRAPEPAPAIAKTAPAPAVAKPSAPPTRVAAALPPPAKTEAPVPAAAKAVVVPPNAVKRTSGSLPTIKAVVRPGTVIPKSLAAKICIDPRGAVTNVQVLKATGEVASAFADAIRGWRYTPYKAGGVATPACFVNSFQLGN